MKYTHGGDIYRNKIKYDFSINVNSLSMPEGCEAVMLDAMKLAGRYPDYKGEGLIASLSRKYNLPQSYFILSNGAAELIYNIAAISGLDYGKGFLSITLAPTFTEYERAVTAFGGNMEYYYLKEYNNFEADEDILQAIGPEHRLVFICNPNNPTGGIIKKELMLKIAAKCEALGSILVVDECFVQFLSDETKVSMIEELDNFNNLIIIRAFTKIYAMAGLRLGYAITKNEKIIERLYRIRQPWPTSVVAQLVGEKALCDEEYLERTKFEVAKERRYLVEELNRIPGIIVYGGYANYIFFKADEGLYERLYGRGFMIRCCADMKGLGKEYYRIGVKTHRENELLINEIVSCNL